MQRTLIAALFLCVCAMLLILLAILAEEPVAGAGGLPHPSIDGMRIGGDGAARLVTIGPLAMAFNCLLLLLSVLLAGLSVHEKRRDRVLWLILLLMFLWQIFVCLQMWDAHRDFLQSGETGFFLGFPIATAWQVYGVWLGAAPLVLFYSLGFRRYIYSEEDEAAFTAVLNADRKQQREKSQREAKNTAA